MAAKAEDVYCTLLMSDSYLPGAAVLAHSLRDCGTTKKIAALVTLESLLYNTITQLQNIFDYVIPVEKIANSSLENLARIDRLDLRFAFTKIALWRQEQFRRIVYIDADVVALRAPDELFDLDHKFAAAPDIGWPDIFNSGVMMLTPDGAEYRSLYTLAACGSSFDGADQGLLNEYFSGNRWHRLSFTYNCTPSSSYQYEPAYRHFRSNISLAHFIGKQKPWQAGRRAMNVATSGAYRELVGRWWSVYDRHYKAARTSALGQVLTADYHLQTFVQDEDSHSAIRSIPAIDVSGRTRSGQIEVPVTNPTEPVERPFEPSQVTWDATRFAPPAGSKAEAGAFPSQKYQMSSSTGLFQTPLSSAESPRDMYYRVHAMLEATERPTPIFPWEKEAKRPTRVFAPSPTPAPGETPEPAKGAVSSLKSNEMAALSAYGPSSRDDVAAGALGSFSRVNAWDNVSSIDHYVRAIRESQAKRGVQVVHNDWREKTTSTSSTSISGNKLHQQPRQESLILTDFPTEVERPSLPVTPAPVPRPTFWGQERDEQGELPAAEGVPNQSDWNPHERLEQLRRTSVAAAEELPKQTPVKETPLRAVPETSSSLTGPSTEETTIDTPHRNRMA